MHVFPLVCTLFQNLYIVSSSLSTITVDICDRQKQRLKKECSVLLPGGKKISPNDKTINSSIKAGISGYTMIHHVNKTAEADFQTLTGFRHGRIQYVEKEPKILRFTSSQTHFCLIYYQF